MDTKRVSLIPFVLCAAVAVAEVPVSTVRKGIVDTALRYQGVPYVYGAESPAAFDCSGFVRYVFKAAAGISLPRTSKAQWSFGKPTALSGAKPGDVLVFDTVGGAPSHVGILVDERSLVHAVSAGPRTGVIVSPLTDKYFAPRLLGARVFVIDAESVGVPPLVAKPESGSAKNGAKAQPVKPAGKPGARGEGAGSAAPTKPAPAAAPKEPVAPKPAGAPKTPTAPAPAAGPGAAEVAAAAEIAVDYVGFTITNEPVIYTDKIPAARGTGLSFAVTNGTGKDGVFEILFYKMDMDPAKHQTLRRDRVTIPAGAMVEVAPYVFKEPGQYKLILKTHDNLKRVERIWKVVEIK